MSRLAGIIRFRSLCLVVLVLAAFSAVDIGRGSGLFGSTYATSDAPNAIVLEQLPAAFASPLYITNAHDGTFRTFIVEQDGIIKLLQPGSINPTIFLDIRFRVVTTGELGLLGLAFHPQYQTNGRFFVNYTRITDAATVIAEYHVSPNNPNTADLEEHVLLVIHQPTSNHNGGMIEFGPDKYLYIGMGDGGFQNDPDSRGQDITDLLGKVLRIDVDHPTGFLPYSSPPDNPYYGVVRGRDEIYAIGMRNLWRFSFDRGTGQLWMGDVGQGQREEIDIGQLGANYGWRVYEGTLCTNLDPELCIPAGFTFPIAEYAHISGRCSITGGYVYRGSRGTLPLGAYVYGDFCTGEIFMYHNGQQTLLLDTPLNISSFGEDEAGEIYVANLNGTVSRLLNPNAPPLRNKRADFDGDGRSDLSVFRAGAGVWYILQSINGAFRSHQLGVGSDRLVPGDYDGDGRTDIAEFSFGNGAWTILQSSNNTLITRAFGTIGDIPVPGDYDGDNRTDVAVFRPSNNVWFVLQSSNGVVTAQAFGATGDLPVANDYDGDGRADIAVYRAGIWYIRRSSDGVVVGTSFGTATDVTVAADYDGDGRADVAVFRPANSTWYLLRSTDGFASQQFGLSTDTPVPGDYDGDGKFDISVFRVGLWYIFQSSNGVLRAQQFGDARDIPIPSVH